MDILSIAVSDTSVLNVRHPISGDDTGIEIELYGSDTIAYKKAVTTISRRNAKRKAGSVSVEELEDATIELLTMCTVSWKNIEEGGKPVKCTPENVKRIYIALPWLRKQIDSFIGDDQNFLSEQAKA